MAKDKTNNLKAYLTDLYEGIVSKKPDASRNPQDFRREIESIETGGGGDALAEGMRDRNGEYLFYNAPITEAPLFDTSKYTTLRYAFGGCSNLLSVPLYNTGNVTNMSDTFYSCKALQTAPLFDTSNVTNMDSMFKSCSALTTVPLFDTSNVTNMAGMFQSCSALTTVPLFDTSNVTTMNAMFNACRALKDVPMFDMRNVTNTGSMFSSCVNLSNVWIRNIVNGVSISSSSHVTVDSLIHLIYELITKSSAPNLTIGSTNLAKLADVYVKAIDITDEMRAEDDLIDEKCPFVRCESTDEGAMLITDYATTVKNWTIK